jgi:predicted flavoprotein YhiN
MIQVLKDLRMTVTRLRAIDEAIVTAGGVDIKEIDPRTMESKLVKGLYFVGEVIDIDAVTGGFNLQAAWSTGYVAGESAAVSGKG